jgi:RNA polymerase sigma-70 factor (ECF subfamily)
MPDDEARLIQLAQQGDAEACAELYDRHYDAVYRYCYYRVGNASLAQDLTSEVFVRMVEKLDTFGVRGHPLLAWLYTIARNLVTDCHRRRGQVHQLALDDVSSLSDDSEENLVRSIDRSTPSSPVPCGRTRAFDRGTAPSHRAQVCGRPPQWSDCARSGQV